MADAGVLLLAGTDVGGPLVFPAFSLADELEALVVDAHLTPLQSLRTATLNVGAWLGKADSIGVIARGARADLVFLTANPLGDIRNVRAIRAVMLGGQLHGRAMLDGLLEQAVQRPNGKRPRPLAPRAGEQELDTPAGNAAGHAQARPRAARVHRDAAGHPDRGRIPSPSQGRKRVAPEAAGSHNRQQAKTRRAGHALAGPRARLPRRPP